MRPHLLALPLALALGGCSPEPIDLDPLAFVPVDGDLDPFAAARPEDDACPPGDGWWIEERAVEADTEFCAWLSVAQPLGVAPRGRHLLGGVSWNELTLLEGDPRDDAEGTIAIAVGGEVLFEETRVIPGPSGFLQVDLDLSGFSRADLVVLHVHNHGPNTWRFLPLRLDRPLE